MATKAFQQNAFQNDAFQWEGNQQRVTFFADAIIFDPSHPVFTADSYIDTPWFEDNFNRGSVGSDYTGIDRLTIENNALSSAIGDWGEATIDTPRTPNPNYILFDFWVPPVHEQQVGYIAYGVNSSYLGTNAYIDNFGPTHDSWAAYLPPSNNSYEFFPDGNTWYRSKWLLSANSGQQVAVKIWKRDEAEPQAWSLSQIRSTTVATRQDHYVYLDGSNPLYPAQIDNLLITRSFVGSFTANAIIADNAEDRHGQFTADALIVRHSLYANLDNDTSPYNSLVTSTGTAQTFTGEYWQAGPSFTRKWYQALGVPEFGAPINVKFDFWVPTDPAGSYYWEARYLLTLFNIDSWPYVDSSNPGTYDFGTRNEGGNHFFPVTGNTWYTLFVHYDNVVGGKLLAKIWPRDTPIPDEWTFDVTITNVQPFALSNVPSIQIRNYGDNPDVVRMDNSLAYSWTVVPAGTFTANAVIFRTTTSTFTANAVLLDPNAVPVEGTFTADAILLKTYAPSNSSNVVTTSEGTQVAVTSQTGITVTYKETGMNEPSWAFVSLSIDLLGGPIPAITPSNSNWHQIASVNDGTNHALITWARQVVNADPNTVSFTWTGARDAAAAGWTVGYAPVVNASLEYRVYTAQDSTLSALIRNATDAPVQDPSLMVPPRRWASYGIFAGSSDTIWTLNNPGGFAYVAGLEADAPNASIRVARDDFNQRTTAFTLFTGDPTTAQPRLSHLIVLNEYGTYFTADALLQDINERTFTANAWLEPVPVYRFTANAVLLKTVSRTFTANSVLTIGTEATFTADAVIRSPDTSFSFTARAVLAGRVIPASEDMPRLAKRTSMSIIKRRPLEFSAYIPPKVPDQEEDDPPPEPYCLPPCPPTGAGGGSTGWGSFKTSLTKCATCGVYYRTDSEFLGRGSASPSLEHYEFCESHSRVTHVTKLWVQYPGVPTGDFLLRAKLTWDPAGPDSLSVRVFNVPEFPTLDEGDGFGSEFDPKWTDGGLLGSFVFVNDATIGSFILLGGEQYKYQREPSDIVVNGATLDTNIFRFELEDEGFFYNAKFRAANLDWE